MTDYRENAIWKVYVHIIPKSITKYDYDKYYVGITHRKAKSRNINSKIGFYARYEQDVISDGNTYYAKDNIGGYPNAKPIYQFTREYEFVKRFISATEASEELQIHRFVISYSAKAKALEINSNCKFLFRYDEDVEKIGDTYVMKEIPETNEILQFDINKNFIQKFVNTSIASEVLNIPQQTIRDSAHYKYQSSKYGFIFRQLQDVEYFDGTYHIKDDERNQYKKIYAFDNNHEFVKCFDNCQEASEFTGIKKGTIFYSVKNKSNTSRFGYIFRYEENVDILDSTIKINDNKICNEKNDFKVFIFDKDKNFLSAFKTNREASNYYNLKEGSISTCAHAKTSLQGYYCRYKEDVEYIDNNFVMVS